MKNVRDVVDREIIEDLWGAGYTILPRRRHPDPFHVPAEMVPQSRSYQWMHLVHDKQLFYGPPGNPNAWAPVPASRHDGYFMPAGHVGDVEVNGLGLFEKPKFEVDRDLAQDATAAQSQVDAWVVKCGGTLSGEVSVNGKKTEIWAGTSFPDLRGRILPEDTTAIPREMVPYIAQIFEERDRLAQAHIESMRTKVGTAYCKEWADWMEDHPHDAQWPALHRILLPTAIENVRKRITEEAESGQAS